ncbi:MAG: peptidogalycan biosysnthesis protein [Pseudomonadota bacterium]
MFRVEWVTSETDIPTSLWEACFDAPYEGRWWYQALERSGLGDQFTFFYGVLYRQNNPVAIAPAFLMDVPVRLVFPPALLPLVNLLGRFIPSLLYQRTFFIGSPCSDEGRVGMRDGVDSLEVLHAINQAMQEYATMLKAPMRVWKDFTDEHQAVFSKLLNSEGLFQLISFPGTELKLEGENKEGYRASLKASRRNKLKKKLDKAANAPVDVHILQQPNAEAMDEIFSLFWQTYNKSTTRFERLNRQFFDLISGCPHVYYVVLRERNSKKIVSFMLCFALGKHVINKFIGIDYSRPKEWFLYFRLWEAAVEWSYSIGARSIQSGQTGYAPKIELGNALVALTNYCKHKNPIIHWIYAAVAKMVNWNTLDKDLSIYAKAYPEHLPNSKKQSS